jgi:Transglycosylase-like domain
MRKLLPIPVLCLAFAVPAIAAEPQKVAPDDGSDGASLIDVALPDPLAIHQAQQRKRRAAVRRRAQAERRAEARRLAEAVAVPAHLQAIALCESGGDPTAIGGGGLYRGKYQFSVETWRAVGGSGDPAAAPEAEQDRRAIALYDQSGAGQWPVCGA